MLNIKRFEVNMLQENCYIVSDESREAVVIDCGAYYDDERQAIADYILQQQLKVTHLVATHGHFDHNFGNDTIFSTCGVKPEVSDRDAALMDLKSQARDMLGITYDRDVPPIGRLLGTDDVITFGTHRLTLIPTPGHTPGSVTFYCEAEHVAFTGDTLFRMSIGRTDFPGGSWPQMAESLQRLAALPADTTVYPGHGPVTTIGDERRYNPYIGYRL